MDLKLITIILTRSSRKEAEGRKEVDEIKNGAPGVGVSTANLGFAFDSYPPAEH